MIIWIMGISGSGKSTLGKFIYKKIKKEHPPTIFIEVGSPTITARGRGKFSTTSFMRPRTPTHPTSSSYEKAK